LEVSAFVGDALQACAAVPVDPRTRRQATILCAEFRRPEQGMESLPPEVALERVDRFLIEAAALVRDNRGAVVAISENELVASFGAPEPLEGHAALACRTALGLRKLALGHTKSMAGTRIALDTGVVIVGSARDQATDVRGGPVSVAHALSQALERDLVVATAKTRASAGGFVSMQQLAAPLVSGFAKGQQLFEVTEIRRGRSRWQLRADV